VAWVNNFSREPNPKLPVGMGVQFLDLKPKDYSSLRKYVESRRILPEW
jgi:hypothetical protein